MEVHGCVSPSSVNSDERWRVSFEDEPRPTRVTSLSRRHFVRICKSAHSVGLSADAALGVGDNDVVAVLQEPWESSRADASPSDYQHRISVESVESLQVRWQSDGIDGVGERDGCEQSEDCNVLVDDGVEDAPNTVAKHDLHERALTIRRSDGNLNRQRGSARNSKFMKLTVWMMWNSLGDAMFRTQEERVADERSGAD